MGALHAGDVAHGAGDAVVLIVDHLMSMSSSAASTQGNGARQQRPAGRTWPIDAQRMGSTPPTWIRKAIAGATIVLGDSQV